MVASSNISLLGFALLSLTLGVFSLPQEQQDVKTLGMGSMVALEEDWTPQDPPPVNDVVFSWCRDYNMSSTCFSAALKHGWCYGLPVLDDAIREHLEDVGAEGGKCMLFRGPDCTGEHTAMFLGAHLWTKFLCQKGNTKWHRQAASVRCCAGSPVTPWCNAAVKKTEACAKG